MSDISMLQAKKQAFIEQVDRLKIELAKAKNVVLSKIEQEQKILDSENLLLLREQKRLENLDLDLKKINSELIRLENSNAESERELNVLLKQHAEQSKIVDKVQEDLRISEYNFAVLVKEKESVAECLTEYKLCKDKLVSDVENLRKKIAIISEETSVDVMGQRAAKTMLDRFSTDEGAQLFMYRSSSQTRKKRCVKIGVK